jgi:hypothetical protein
MIKLFIKVININKNVLINILTKSKAPKEIALILGYIDTKKQIMCSL